LHEHAIMVDQIDANVLPSGTQVYTVKGQDQTKVIAVDNGQQGYVEVVNAGSKQPKYEEKKVSFLNKRAAVP
jgi:hypothetical protein